MQIELDDYKVNGNLKPQEIAN